MNKAAQPTGGSGFLHNPYVEEIIKLAVPLLVITLIVAGCLGAVNAITADRIAQIEVEKTHAAMGAVIEGASFTPVDFTDETGMITGVYTATVNGEYAGMCLQVSPNGFSAAIGMIVGISPENEVLGVEIVSSSETSGLGSRASEDEWRAQFVGKTGPLTVQKNTATGENDIVAITGATITSQAVTDGVQAALDYATANQPGVTE